MTISTWFSIFLKPITINFQDLAYILERVASDNIVVCRLYLQLVHVRNHKLQTHPALAVCRELQLEMNRYVNQSLSGKSYLLEISFEFTEEVNEERLNNLHVARKKTSFCTV